MVNLYFKNKYTPIVLISLGLSLIYIVLVFYYFQMIDDHAKQHSLYLQEELNFNKEANILPLVQNKLARN